MRTRESPLRDVLRLLVWYPGRAAARLLPDPIVLRTLEAAGSAHAALRRRRARDVAKVIGDATGASAETASRASVIALRTHYLDRLHIFLYPRLVRRSRLPEWLSIEGRDRLDAALGRGRGVVLVHPHYGVAQLLPLALGLTGYATMQVGWPSAEGLSAVGRAVAFRGRLELEALLPARILRADGYLRPAFSHLSQGGIVCITGDGTGGGRFRGRHVPVPLLGRRMLMPIGPAKIALRSGAALLPAIVARRAKGFVARIEEELPVPDPGRGESIAIALTACFAHFLEARLREEPGPWHFWEEFHPGGLLLPDDGEGAPS